MRNEPIKKDFVLPDGAGGEQLYYFTTSDDRVIMSDGKFLIERVALMMEKLRAINRDYITPSKNQISEILRGIYISADSDGEGEENGVPTRAEVKAVLTDNYTHTDKKLSEFAVKDVIASDTVVKILQGTY